MMMGSSREGGNYQAKQEDAAAIDMNKFSKVAAASSTTTSKQWSSAFRNPRIVRVSRSFGGKDRHSKVCTIRGLRDRRIRLSVPTAIQLYDLQDKLGLTQPSKVIDWLLEATKFDIDKLPPLQFPQSFSQFHQYHHPAQTLLPLHDPSAASLSLGPLYDPNSSTFMGIQNLMAAKSRFWDNMDKGKELAERGYNDITENNVQNSLQQQVSTQRLFPMGTTTQSHHSPNLLNINAMSSSYNNNSYHNSDPSGLSLSSQFGSHGGLFHNSQHQQVDPSNNNGLQFQIQPSNLPLLPSGGSQLLFGSTSAATVPPSLLTTPFVTVENNNNDYPRSQYFNHFQFLNSSSSSSGSNIPLIPSLHHSLINSTVPVRPFPSLPFSSKLLDSDNNNNSNRSSQQDYKGSGSARS